MKTSAGSLPLHLALRKRAEPEVVKLVLAAFPQAAHAVDSSGWLPLHIAIENESAAEVVSLVREANPGAASQQIQGPNSEPESQPEDRLYGFAAPARSW
eukprot:COSAG05_NODE_3600_length_1966_cov_29.942153_3_plen_99_part_00